MALTEGAISPDLFKRWTAIAMVAGALERRVWCRAGGRITFPNLYTLLVAPPGVGKYIIEEARQLWTEAKEPGSSAPAFHVAPDNMTKAALLDTLAKAKSIRLVPKGPAITYHSLLVAAEEFQVLLPAFDQEFIGALNSIYNNKPLHEEARRYGPTRELAIPFPQFNILGGAQPSYFVSTFPEEAWTTGFARRIIMIYSNEVPYKDLFHEPEIEEALRARVLYRLGQISALFGEMIFSQEAASHLAQWHKSGGPPVPQHSKLAHYNRSRSMFALKLSTISGVSRTGKLEIDLIDVKRAIAWLVEAEGLMPDIFREMIGRSDSQIVEELHYYMINKFNKERQKPIISSDIMRFLMMRCPVEKAETIFRMAERANVIARVAGTEDLFVPRPKYEHGVE
jgi:hypothetical protein